MKTKYTRLLVALALLTLVGLGLTALPQTAAAVPYVFSGTGMSADPYLINDELDLRGLANNVNNEGFAYAGEFFAVKNNIVLTNEWIPIGNDPVNGKIFQGNLNGENHVISDLSITKEYYGYLGLFGATEQSEVKNLVLRGAIIVNNLNPAMPLYVGGLRGSDHYGSIEHVISEVNVNITTTGNATVGGLSGEQIGGTLNYTAAYFPSFAGVRVYADGTATVGGLVGTDSASIMNSFVGKAYPFASPLSEVFAHGKSVIVGGLVGDYQNSGDIALCYTTCDVTAESAVGPSYAGGLAGTSSFNIDNVYTTGTVKVSAANVGNYNIGGLVAVNNNNLNGGYFNGQGGIPAVGNGTLGADVDPLDPYTQMAGAGADANMPLFFPAGNGWVAPYTDADGMYMPQIKDWVYAGTAYEKEASRKSVMIPATIGGLSDGQVDVIGGIGKYGDGWYPPGVQVDIYAGTISGMVFSHWIFPQSNGNGVVINDLNAPLTFLTMNGDIIVEAVFVPVLQNNLIVVADTGGSIAPPDPSGYYTAGDSVKIVAVPAAGYVFARWTVTDNFEANFGDANAAATSFLMPIATAPITVTAHFRQIIPPDNGGGTGTSVPPVSNPTTPGTNTEPSPPAEDVNNPDTPLGAPTPGEPDPEPGPDPNPHTGAGLDLRLLLLPLLWLVAIALSRKPEGNYAAKG
jgi:uncharacterized repeat protein (TIGR02543 family)